MNEIKAFQYMDIAYATPRTERLFLECGVAYQLINWTEEL
jgi:hypothetical protein